MVNGENSRVAVGRRARRLVILGIMMAAVLWALMTVYTAIVIPVAISFFLVYLFEPLVDRLENSGIARSLSSLCISVVLVAVLVIGAVLLSPVVYAQLTQLFQRLPDAASKVINVWLPTTSEWLSHLGVPKDFIASTVNDLGNMTEISHYLSSALSNLWSSAPDLIGGVISLALVPVMTFFLLKDFPRVVIVVLRHVPLDLRPLVIHTAHRLHGTLRAVLKGHVIVALTLAVLYVVGFTAIGLNSGAAIGIVAGLARFIPYFDLVVGGSLVTLVLLSDFTGWWQVFAAAGVFGVVQVVDGMFITPKVIGQRLGLHPGVVIASVIAFGDLFGFWGVLLAIPTVASLKVLIELLEPAYLNSQFFMQPAESGIDVSPSDVSLT